MKARPNGVMTRRSWGTLVALAALSLAAPVFAQGPGGFGPPGGGGFGEPSGGAGKGRHSGRLRMAEAGEAPTPLSAGDLSKPEVMVADVQIEGNKQVSIERIQSYLKTHK